MSVFTSLSIAVSLAFLAGQTPSIARDVAPGSAKEFVDAIYRQYERTGKPPRDSQVFSSELAGLIARDDAIAAKSGEPNLIDYVLLCGCNDDGDMRFSTSVLSSTPKSVLIRIAATVAGKPAGNPFILRVTQAANGWRVSDIITNGRFGGSLLNNLRKGLAGTGGAASGNTFGAPAQAKAAAGRQSRSALPLRPAATRPVALPPFDLALAAGGLPLGDSATWSGVEIEKTSYSAATLHLVNIQGKLSGTAEVRAPSRGSGATLSVTGKYKDGSCQIKIDQFGSFKGPCTAAGFLGRKSFLGETEGSLYVYTGGAEAMTRAAAALPQAFGYAGKSDAAFREDEFFTLRQASGMLLGTWRSTFSQAGVIGVAFDGSCLLVTTGVYSFQGRCDAASFSGRALRNGKPDSTLTLTGMSTGELAAAIAVMEQGQAQAQSAIQQYEAPRQPVLASAAGKAGDGSSGARWFYGRDRWVVAPGGGCSAAGQLLRGYCFDAVMNYMRGHPSEATVAVVALTAPAPLGTFVGNDTPVRYSYFDVTRQGDGFAAKRVMHGTSKVSVPIQLAARCHGLSLRDGFEVAGFGPKGLKEAALYPCQ